MNFRKKFSKRLTITGVALLVATVLAIGGLIIWNKKNQESERGPKPQGNSASQFLYQEIYYDCSKEIKGKWEEAAIGWDAAPGYYFYPDSQSDLNKYCRMNGVIEYRAVLDILRRDDVAKTIEKYDPTQAWVRALGHKYINDKAYLKRILPAYSNLKIDCIIVVHSPEGTRFFIENGETHDSHADHKYIEVPAAEFLASINNASDTDTTNFWLGLH